MLLACGPLALGARAAESPANGGSPAPLAKFGPAFGRDPPGTEARLATGRPATQESSRLGSGGISGSGPRHAVAVASPRHGSVTAPHAAAIARGRLARASIRPAPSAAPAGSRVAPRAQGPTGTHSHELPKTSVAASPSGIAPSRQVGASAVRVPQNLKAAARGPMLGGPRAAGAGRLGGPAIRRSAINTGIDGTQIHRKY